MHAPVACPGRFRQNTDYIHTCKYPKPPGWYRYPESRAAQVIMVGIRWGWRWCWGSSRCPAQLVRLSDQGGALATHLLHPGTCINYVNRFCSAANPLDRDSQLHEIWAFGNSVFYRQWAELKVNRGRRRRAKIPGLGALFSWRGQLGDWR